VKATKQIIRHLHGVYDHWQEIAQRCDLLSTIRLSANWQMQRLLATIKKCMNS